MSVASRYNLLTGVRTTTSGLYNFGFEFRDVYPDATTLPQFFMNAGCHTEAIGKVFHVGHGNTNDKASWSIPHLPPNRELPRGAAWESPDVLDEAYGDGRIATHAIDRLRELNKNPNQPFFMALGFARPHLPFCAPKKYWDMYNPDNLPMPQYEKDPENARRWPLREEEK